MKNPETGHVKNVANFSDLISKVQDLGTVYNPANASLKLDALTAVQKIGQEAIDKVSNSFSDYKAAINKRNLTFEPLSKLSTSIVYMLDLLNAPKQSVKNAKTIARKIKGERAKKINPENLDKKHISASQMSFDNRVANFKLLIDLLQNIPEYKPNEKDLQIDSLIALHKIMVEKNLEVINARTSLGSLRDARNKILYSPTTGMYDIALASKKYVRVLFGTESKEYKRVRKIIFKKQ